MITHSFGIVNYLVLFGYLLAMMLVGVYFSRRQKTADDYFRGGGRVPGWAAGVSVFATTLSSITFMSIPAKAFTSDWTFIIGQYLAIAILPLVFYFYIPFFRKLKVTSAYEYLEARVRCALPSIRQHVIYVVSYRTYRHYHFPHRAGLAPLHRYRPGDFGTVD
ncbi:hypothetical protein AH382_002361 [Salmonella enterica subsp. enterica]|nr:hypothetical protein [Salmonella enterica subsp. enterica]